jgi:two-component system response regulator PilR (NtrC family)
VAQAREAARPARPSRPSARLLIVDDEQSMRDMLRIVLKRDGYDVQVAENGKRAIELLRRESFDLLVSDIQMPDATGVDVLRVAKDVNRDIVVFMMTAFASTDTAVEAMRLGAVDYLTKPFNVDELRLKVRQQLEARRLKEENVPAEARPARAARLSNVIGRSPAMLALFQMVGTVAKTSSTVLVTGESGTGKEMVARAIHENSLRREHPFVALNAARCPRRCSSRSSSAT